MPKLNEPETIPPQEVEACRLLDLDPDSVVPGSIRACWDEGRGWWVEWSAPGPTTWPDGTMIVEASPDHPTRAELRVGIGATLEQWRDVQRILTG